MNVLNSRRRTLVTRLGRVEEIIRQHQINPLNQAMVKVQLDFLEAIGNDCQRLEDETLARARENQIPALEQEFADIIQQFTTAKATLLQLQQPALAPPVVPVQPIMAQQNQVQVKLPKLDLPKFSGDLLEWTTFHDRFVASVHSKDISPCLKFEYLSASVVGEAAEAIRNIPLTDENYNDAWELLKKRFQNNRKIATLHVNRLMDQPAVGSDVGDGLRKLVYCTNECVRALRVLDLPVDTWNFIICNAIEKKLDSNTKRQWELTFEEDRYPELANLLAFIEKHARSFEDNSTSQSLKLQQQNRNSAPTDSSHCQLCKEIHPTFRCPKLMNANHNERQELVRNARLCFNCLVPGHSSQDCRGKTCKICHERHNTVLHGDSSKPLAAITSNMACFTSYDDYSGQKQDESLTRPLLDSGQL